MIIKQISFDKENFYKVEGNIDIINKKVVFEIPLENFKKILNLELKSLYWEQDKVLERTNYIYIVGENDVIYSCIECIFNYSIKNNIRFESVSINIIMENIISDSLNIKCSEVTFKTTYIGNSKHFAFIKNYNFKYDVNKTVFLNVYKNENVHIDISIKSKKEFSYEDLSKIIYTIIEMIMLYWGDIPDIREIILTKSNKKIKVYFDLVDKYKSTKVTKEGNNILSTITINNINEKNIKKFFKFRKKTQIIYDLFMITINSNNYIEMKNCNLVQEIEGLYKVLIDKNERYLRDILIYFFDHYNNSKKILSKRDKRKLEDDNNTQIFIYKAKNHRDYLSHLNMNQNKNVFVKRENVYAYWKLCLCIRVFILEYLNFNYDKELLIKRINMINKWSKKEKIRFSSKINN